MHLHKYSHAETGMWHMSANRAYYKVQRSIRHSNLWEQFQLTWTLVSCISVIWYGMQGLMFQSDARPQRQAVRRARSSFTLSGNACWHHTACRRLLHFASKCGCCSRDLTPRPWDQHPNAIATELSWRVLDVCCFECSVTEEMLIKPYL